MSTQERGLVDRAVTELRAYIRKENMKAGDSLPSEQALSAQLGVSRTVAREAMRALAALGVLQIGNRLIHEGATLRVCQETICRYIYAQEGMAQELWWYLPEHRRARRPRRARKRRAPKFDRDVSILFRPDDVAHRREFGH